MTMEKHSATILLLFEDVSKNYQYSIKNNDNSNNFIYTWYSSHFIYLLLFLASCIGCTKKSPEISPYPSYVTKIKANQEISSKIVDDEIQRELEKKIFIKNKLVEKDAPNKEVTIKLLIHGFADNDNNNTQVFSNIISRICEHEYDKSITILAPKISDTKIDLHEQCEEVYNELDKCIIQAQKDNYKPKIVISGYSMGGIVTLLLVLKLKEDGKAQDIKGLNIITAPLGGIDYVGKILEDLKKDEFLINIIPLVESMMLAGGTYKNRPKSYEQLNHSDLIGILNNVKKVIDEYNITTKVIAADKPENLDLFSDTSIVNKLKLGYQWIKLNNKVVKPFDYYLAKLKNIITRGLTKHNDIIIPIKNQLWPCGEHNYIKNIILQEAIHFNVSLLPINTKHNKPISVLDTQELADIIIDSMK